MNETTAHFLVYTLGGLSLEHKLADGTCVPVSFLIKGPVTYEKHIESLLGYLLCCPRRQALRPTIMSELWEGDLVSVDTYMYRATSGLKNALDGEPYFKRTQKKQRYILADQSQIWNDAEHCEGLIEAAKGVGPTTNQGIAFLQEAHYYLSRGIFLPRETGSWAYTKRSKMQTLLSDSLNWLLDAYEAKQEYKLLEETAEQVLRTDPFNCNALYRLMIALDKQWMGQEALRRYRETTVLARKGGQVLSSDVQELAQQLGQKRHNRPIRSASLPSSDLMASPPSQRVNPQGIMRSEEANTHSLKTRNLRDYYLASSTEIVSSLKAYSSLSQTEATTCQQQMDIYAEIEQRRTMSDEYTIDPSQITRRDLFTLAMVSPLPLASSIWRRQLTISVAEEFLSEVTASMTTCWYLLQGNGLHIVELTLPQYLPWLVELVKHYPTYRYRASYLAAQGFLLLSLIDLHRVRYAERVAHCQQAVTYALESGDLTLLVTSLGLLGDAFFINGQLNESLKTYLQAEDYSKSTKIAGLSRSRVLAGSSLVHAQQGNDQKAGQYLGEAHTPFAEEDHEIPIFLLADHGPDRTILDEGGNALALGNHAKDQGNLDRAQKYWKDAAEKFGKIEQLPSSISVPARIAAEIEIARALAYAKAGDMEEFLTTFKKGAKMAMELGSEKRKEEAKEALKAALEQWPNDQRIIGLWQLLI